MIPDPVKLAIAALVTFLVTNGLKSLGALLGKDLSGYAAVVAALVTATVIFFFDSLIAALPVDAQTLVAKVLELLVLFLGAAGIHYSLKNSATKKAEA